MPKKNIKSRGWCFTVQSWDEEDVAFVADLYEGDTNCTYLIIGWEKAPRTGKEHLQCYIYYTNALRWTEMQSRLQGIHFDNQKAKKNVEAYYYCAEDGDWYEFGNRPRQGHRSDLAMIAADIRDKKKTIKDVSKDYPSQWIQYRRSFDEYARLHQKYETQFVVYEMEHEHLQRIYTEYPVHTSLIIKTEFDKTPHEVLHDFHSGQYSHIFYPGPEVNNIYIPIITEYL